MARRASLWLVLAMGCGAARVPESPSRAADAAFAPHRRAAITHAPPPTGCRAPTGRAIPAAPIAYASLQAGEHVETFTLGSRLVALVHGAGRTPAAIWDAETNAWSDPGPGPTTWAPGDTGPFGDTRFHPVGDHVVVLWENASQRAGVQGALLDVIAARWLPLSLEGAPEGAVLDAVDSAGRLFVTASSDLAHARRFDPVTNRWALVATDGVPPITGWPTIVALGDRVLALGAAASGRAIGALYDPERDVWSAIADGPPIDVGFVATTDDAIFWWSAGDERHGGIWSRARDEWTPVAGADAPYSHALGARLFAFTGAHVVQAEEHPEDRGRAHDPIVVFDVATSSFRRIPAPPTFAPPIALPDGRVVFFAGGQPTRVVDPASGVVCTPDVSALPTLASMGTTSFEHIGVIGDELVLWGRMDTMALLPPCPPGAPCMPMRTAATHRDDGVAIRF